MTDTMLQPAASDRPATPMPTPSTPPSGGVVARRIASPASGPPKGGANAVGLIDEGPDRGRLEALLRTLGFRIVDLRTVPDGDAPALVIADARTPGAMDRCAMLAGGRAVAMVSPDTSFGFRLRATRSGATGVIGAPVDPVDLRDWLARQSAPRPSLRVLVLDDDPFAAEAYAATLDAAGMTAHALNDPTRAFDAIDAHRPDLMLLDMNMPDADGMEIARIIRQHPHALRMPIVFLSAESDVARRLDARRVGGDDFIAKPVDLETLADLVAMRGGRALALRELAETDGLTGLLNRAALKERIDGLAAHGGADGGRRATDANAALSVAMLEIEGFDDLCDEHGPAACDALLQTLARTLLGNLRVDDLIARYDREVFAIALPGARRREALAAIERVRASFSRRALSVGRAMLRPRVRAVAAQMRETDGALALLGRATSALNEKRTADHARPGVHARSASARPETLAA